MTLVDDLDLAVLNSRMVKVFCRDVHAVHTTSPSLEHPSDFLFLLALVFVILLTAMVPKWSNLVKEAKHL